MIISSKVLRIFLVLFNFKSIVKMLLRYPQRSPKPNFVNRLKRKYCVHEFYINDKYVFTILPNAGVSKLHIMFFHGGAYVLQGSSSHAKVLEYMVCNINCKISYLDYPLAPESSYHDTFEMLEQSFQRLIALYPSDRFIFMGDSAGGGLALAFAQKLMKENAEVQPVKNILFSPWLDISMSNPEIKKQEKQDKILPLDGLIEAGKCYSNGEDPKNYLLSPIHGKLEDIGHTLVFYGTSELFYPDCIKLQIKTSGTENFTFHEYAEMQHDWIILPIPEAKLALNQAINFILN